VTARTFETLDRLDVPDLRRDIERRRRVPDELRSIPKPPTGGRRVTAALLALAVFLAAAAFGLRIWTRDQHPRPATDPWSWAGEGWTRIPDPPERYPGATWAWAADRLLVWGGCTGDTTCDPTGEGSVFDARTRTWSSIPPAPRPGHDEQAVAVGDRIYLFGRDGFGSGFDVVTNAWTDLPRAPIEPDHAVWIGARIIVLQDAAPSGRASAAASFDPTTNEWQTLTKPPIDFNVATVTWTGQDVLVLSGLLNDRNVPASPTVDAMSLDPTTGRWHVLPRTALDPGSFASAYLGERLYAWDYVTRWQSFDPGANTWSPESKLPVKESECYVSGATVGSVVFDWNCGAPAILDGGTWATIRGGPVEETIYSKAYQREVGVWRFADLVPAGDVLILPLTGITLAGGDGEACYGCPGSPESLWVYRPRAGGTTESATGELWPGIGEGMTALPAPPHVLASTTQVWTGRELIVWGGNERFGDPPHFNEGYAFDASTLAWRDLPPSPLEGRSWATGVWDGQEVVIWGGATGYARDDGMRSDGAAYDPRTRTWRVLAQAPISGTPALGSVWTGREMVVIGATASAAYAPNTDSWRRLSDPPAQFDDASLVWTGQEVIVFGDRGGDAAAGVAYDPVADLWHELPAPHLPEDGLVPTDGIDANASAAVWDGTRVVSVDYTLRAAAFDPSTNAWSQLPLLPVNSCEGYPVAVSVMGASVVELCGEDVILSPGDDRWNVVSGRGEHALDWSMDLVSAGDMAILLPSPTESGRYRMYVYAPPGRVPDQRRAWDVAAAFGAIRCQYPIVPGKVPPTIEQEISSLVSSDAATNWEDPASGLGSFWGYTGFEVRSVERGGDGISYEVRVRFTPISGSDADETLTIAPGAALDGRTHDLVVVGVRPG
jgi:hypothetical protein